MAGESEPDPLDTGLTGKARQASDWIHANRSHWVRGLLMIAFFLVLSVVRLLVGLIALFQLGSLLLTGQSNGPLRRFGASFAFYTSDLVAYLTCATDDLPFPFSEWPRARPPE